MDKRAWKYLAIVVAGTLFFGTLNLLVVKNVVLWSPKTEYYERETITIRSCGDDSGRCDSDGEGN